MTIERANQLINAVCCLPFAEMGIEQDIEAGIAILHGASLANLIEAKEVIRADNEAKNAALKDGESRVIVTLPDDRLIAATYAFVHHLPRPGDHGDNLILSAFFPECHLFLAVGSRRRDIFEESGTLADAGEN